MATHGNTTTTERQPDNRRLVWTVWFVVAAAWLVLDQVTKILAVEELSNRSVDLGFIALNLVRNPNAAFGIPGFPGMFVIVTVVVLILIVRSVPRAERLSLALAYGLITGGALGNGLDRMLRFPGFPNGHVIDMFDLGWFPVFNVADSGIVVGTALLALLLLRAEREERQVESGCAAGPSMRSEAGPPRP